MRAGYSLRRSNRLPEGHVYNHLGTLFAGPLTYWSLQHEGRYPMLSLNSRGMRELDRDRRAHCGEAA